MRAYRYMIVKSNHYIVTTPITINYSTYIYMDKYVLYIANNTTTYYDEKIIVFNNYLLNQC